MRMVLSLALLAAIPAFAQAASTDSGQDYPSKPVRLVVGFPAGASLDAAARTVAGKLSEAFKYQVIVDNRAGAGGNIGVEIVAKSRPDGYTLLMGANGALAVNPALYSNLPFDSVRDFSPIALVASVTNVLVLNPATPASSVEDLIKLAKGRVLNCGSGGVGTPGHLALEVFNHMAGTKIAHVPYKGSGPALIDLMGGNIQLIFSTAAPALPHIKTGKLKGIAVTTAKRSALLPDLPTVAEAGLKDFEVSGWYGLLAPARTPRPIVEKLNRETVRALQMEDVKQAMFVQGLDVQTSTAEEFRRHLPAEMARWAKVVKDAGIRVE